MFVFIQYTCAPWIALVRARAKTEFVHLKQFFLSVLVAVAVVFRVRSLGRILPEPRARDRAFPGRYIRVCHPKSSFPIIYYIALSIPLVPYTPTLRHMGGPFVSIGWIRTANANLGVSSSCSVALLPSSGAIGNTWKKIGITEKHTEAESMF